MSLQNSDLAMWLIWNRKDGYKTVKVCTIGAKVNRELEIYDHLSKIKLDHDGGRYLIRHLHDHFQIDSKYGKHACLVHEPLGMSLHYVQQCINDRVLRLNLLRPAVRYAIAALDFLHTRAHIIHTGRYAIHSLTRLLS